MSNYFTIVIDRNIIAEYDKYLIQKHIEKRQQSYFEKHKKILEPKKWV